MNKTRGSIHDLVKDLIQVKSLTHALADLLKYLNGIGSALLGCK